MRRDNAHQRGARQRGFALLVVLWTLGLLALLGTQLLATGRQDTQLARNLLDSATLEAAANGAVQQAVFGVLDGSDQHWSPDGSVRTVQLGHAVVTVRIEAEQDKVNPNIASARLLQALLVQVGADADTAAAVAASIVEWRMASGVADRPNATVARYAAAGRDYAPSGAPFASTDELGAVLGMTPELLASLRPHLTVFTEADPSAATQDVVVAQALAAAGQHDADAGEDATGPVSITADARGTGQARFAVHVIVRANARPDGRRYEILGYERLGDDQP
jgi:general secretion pathway protein K